MTKLNRPGNYVTQQRLENNVVLAIDERNLRLFRSRSLSILPRWGAT